MIVFREAMPKKCLIFFVFAFTFNGIASAQGVDPATQIQQEAPQAIKTIASMIVASPDSILVESYYGGAKVKTPNNIYSVTKTITGLLIGQLITEGKIHSLDDRVSRYLPELFTGNKVHPSLRALTLRNLITMQSGLGWDLKKQLMELSHRVNNMPLVLRQPPRTIPGTTFNYDDANAHLLSMIITRLTRMNASTYASRTLFKSLGISAGFWGTDLKGNSIGGYSILMSSRDMLQIGRLILAKGKWKGQQLISEQFISEASSLSSPGGWPGMAGYGYLLWIDSLNGQKMIYGLGYGGQFIAIFPDLNQVVIITCRDGLALDGINIPKDFIRTTLLPWMSTIH